MLLTCAISWIKPFLRKIISLHLDGLQMILFSLDQVKNWSTKSVRQWPLLQTGTMRVESSAYHRAGWLSMLISRSLIKMKNKYGPTHTALCSAPIHKFPVSQLHSYSKWIDIINFFIYSNKTLWSFFCSLESQTIAMVGGVYSDSSKR